MRFEETWPSWYPSLLVCFLSAEKRGYSCGFLSEDHCIRRNARKLLIWEVKLHPLLPILSFDNFIRS